MQAAYDTIGRRYCDHRIPDPRITVSLNRKIGRAQRIVNIGAGTGSYEPADRDVIAVEPSAVMIAQRPQGAPPVVQARAENLPFLDGSFELAMAILTIHHWTDRQRGLAEAARVANGRIILLTWIGFPRGFWLLDYLPEIEKLDMPMFPGIEDLRHCLGPINVEILSIPHDCTDGFLCAYWRRPEAYLEPEVQSGISTFSRISQVQGPLEQLAADLKTGEWERRYGALLARDSFDYGYRIITSGGTAA